MIYIHIYERCVCIYIHISSFVQADSILAQNKEIYFSPKVEEMTVYGLSLKGHKKYFINIFLKPVVTWPPLF